MAVNWIISNIALDSDGMCETNHLYDVFKSNCAESGKVSIQKFIKLLFGLMGNHMSKVRSRKPSKCSSTITPTCYRGISLVNEVDHDILTKFVPFDNIKDYIWSTMDLRSYSSEMIHIQQESDYLCDGNSVYKVLKFYDNGRFEIIVSGRTVDLETLDINPTYELKQNSIQTVFAILNSLKLCTGRRTKEKQVTVSRAIMANIWTCGGEDFMSLTRPMCCSKVVPFNTYSKKSICRKCQKLTINDIDKKCESESEDIID